MKNYERDDFSLIIVYGNLRKGKSSYAMKCVEQALQYLRFEDELNGKNLKWYMGWKPDEVVETWLLNEERQPVFIWDDAGYWLHSMNWHDPLMISIQQYFNVVGTDYNTVILTTPSPDWVLSKIANFPEMIRIKIIKRTGGKRDSDSVVFGRQAIGYQKWRSPDLKRGGVNKILVDDFNCKIRQDLYDWYAPIRRDYAREAKLSIMQNLRQKSNEARLNEMNTLRKLRKAEKELFGQAMSQEVVEYEQ